jgi:hypothetical protein
MKKTILVFTGVLFFGAFYPSRGATGFSLSRAKTEITNDFSNLVQAEMEIQKSQGEVDKSRAQLERNVLSQSERASLRDLVGKDKAIISAYRTEALDDVEFLNAHGGTLTQAQKDTVAEAKIDLED